MNAVHTNSRRHTAAQSYPNAANRRYFLDRFADGLLSAAICIGIVTILFFLITMI